MKSLCKTICILAMTLLSQGLSTASKADPVEDFYRGRTIRLIVGYGPGGGYDIFSRLIARHMQKYVSGQPPIVVQNMPGAGSLTSVNYLASVAERDGTVIAAIDRSIPLLGLLDVNNNVKFDVTKFTWLGSSSDYSDDASLMFIRKDAAVKTIEDARIPGGPQMLIGGTGQGGTGDDVAHILKDVLKLNIKNVPGYPDSNAINLSMERGEVDGRIVDYSSIVSGRPQWLRPDSPVHVLMQYGRITRHPSFPNVPIARELALNDADRLILELAETPSLIARPYAGPPEMPPERAQALRKAFMDTHRDPAFLEEAKKLGLGISPIDDKRVNEVIMKIATAPPPLLERLKKIYRRE